MESKNGSIMANKTSVLLFNQQGQILFGHKIKETYCTASIIKVAIAYYLIKNNVNDEYDKIERMLRISDNEVTSELWKRHHLEQRLEKIFLELGMIDTFVGKEGYWGLTTTTAYDQFLLWKRIIVFNNRFLLHCLNNIQSNQKWGVSTGVPSECSLFLKNGWSPREESYWRINSGGFIQTKKETFGLIILSEGHVDLNTGIDHVNEIAQCIWRDFFSLKQALLCYNKDRKNERKRE